MTANTIDEVIDNLDKIIETSRQENSALGYFAAIYQRVTIMIKEKLGQNFFDDDERMEKLDIIFANRYLSAYTDFSQQNDITKSWEFTFTQSNQKKLIVLQHLLLGMNAHINLDLGIAADEISVGHNIDNLKDDFNRINTILSDLVDEVQENLATIWPKLLCILKFFKKVDNFLIDFSMAVARDEAWQFAKSLSSVDDRSTKKLIIEDRDETIRKMANTIIAQGAVVRFLFFIIRMSERGSISDKIDALRKNS